MNRNTQMPAPAAATDELLIRQFNDGDPGAFSELYQRHMAGVYRRVRFVIPEADVEDVTQEVFLAAFKSLPSFRGESQFGTWLRTLTNHKVAEYYRRRNRRREAPQAPLDETLEAPGETGGRLLEERLILRRALQRLPEAYREVILLRFAEGLQFNEISGLNGQSLEATKSLFRRAISALRDHLDE